MEKDFLYFILILIDSITEVRLQVLKMIKYQKVANTQTDRSADTNIIHTIKVSFIIRLP
jgi:hypothetical protein